MAKYTPCFLEIFWTRLAIFTSFRNSGYGNDFDYVNLHYVLATVPSNNHHSEFKCFNGKFGNVFSLKKNPLCLWDPRLTKKTLIKEKISVIGDSFRSILGCSQMLDCYVHREFLSISYHQNQCLYRTFLQHQFGASPIIEGLLLTGLIQKCRKSHILQNVVEFSLSFRHFFELWLLFVFWRWYTFYVI